MTALLLVAALWAAPARATGASDPRGGAGSSVGDWLADQDSGEAAKRRLAIRTLRGVVRAEVRRSGRPGGDELVRQEAALILQDLDHRLAPRCAAGLTTPELTVPCADILRRLETTDALPALRAALATEARGRARRRLQRAIGTLEGYRGETP